jgi:cytochrome c556
MQLERTGALALSVSVIAVMAWAHSGATGVVLDRMKGMTAMREAVAELAPIMQGAIPYDASLVAEGARVISGHAGENMLSLFPKGSREGVTYAKSEIWSDWREFAELAEELETYANALSLAAVNGLQPATPRTDAIDGMDHSDMAMTPKPQIERGFTVAELMGYAKRTPIDSASRGTAEPSAPAGDLTTQAADALFAGISGTCSACHSRFRAGRS